MQQLDFAELDEDGRLVVVADDGTRYAVPVDDRLRAALRPRRAAPADGGQAPAASPREVQAMIRAGRTVEEVAEATGWDPERVRRFEGPVLAEREHVVGLARAAHVRAQGRTDGTHTLERRVRERLEARGVPASATSWDAARSEGHGPWTVLVAFTAGGRERRAAWHYDVQDRSIEALDDEARWLSEDEQALPGGLAGHPLLGSSHSEDETADLMATMRERRQARGRRPRRAEADKGGDAREPGAAGHADEVLPLENLPEPVDGSAEEPLPPAAHPRGSAPESPAPVHPPEDEAGPAEEAAPTGGSEDAAEGAAPEGRTGQARGTARPRPRRERRRLRMPKLPPAVGEPPEEDEAGEPEGSFARTVDPQEVSFEEFFGPVDDPLGEADPGQDEPVAQEEQIEAAPPAEVHPPDPAQDDVARPAPVDEDPEQVDPAPEEPVQPRRKGRTSVPSWDDVMFGGSDRRRR